MKAAFANPESTDVRLTLPNGQIWAVKPGDPRLTNVSIAPYEPQDGAKK